MDELIEHTRKQLTMKAARIGVKKEYTRVETTKLLALQFKELSTKKRKYEKPKMWDF